MSVLGAGPGRLAGGVECRWGGGGTDCLDSVFVAVLQLGLRSEVQCLRVIVTMACTECKERNYTTTKNKKNDPNRLEFKKFCPTCRRHTLHRETR